MVLRANVRAKCPHRFAPLCHMRSRRSRIQAFLQAGGLQEVSVVVGQGLCRLWLKFRCPDLHANGDSVFWRKAHRVRYDKPVDRTAVDCYRSCLPHVFHAGVHHGHHVGADCGTRCSSCVRGVQLSIWVGPEFGHRD